MRTLILASSSQPRKLLLERFKIPFQAISPNVDESPLEGEAVDKLVARLAKAKAFALSSQFTNSLIIGADQVGMFEETVLCKPLTYENAVKQLQMVSGKTVRFFTGLALLDTQSLTCQLAVETFDVVFRTLTQKNIENYLKNENALHCAGSFTVEGLGIALLEKLQGDDYTALIGLPLIRLQKMLQNAGCAII